MPDAAAAAAALGSGKRGFASFDDLETPDYVFQIILSHESFYLKNFFTVLIFIIVCSNVYRASPKPFGK